LGIAGHSRALWNAPVAQLDRAPDYESGGREFESLRARHFGTKLGTPKPAVFALEAATSVRIMEFATLEAIVNCVGAGLGVTLLPRALIGQVWRNEQVAVHALSNGDGLVETVFVRHRDVYSGSALGAFLEMVRPSLAALRAAE
jgi:DNA-binding transcriptional LysR family regulator